jgi:hypothetical protein
MNIRSQAGEVFQRGIVTDGATQVDMDVIADAQFG